MSNVKIEKGMTMNAGDITIWASANSQGEWKVNSNIVGNKYAPAGQEKESWKSIGKSGGVTIGIMRGLTEKEKKDPMKELDKLSDELQKLAASKTPLPNLSGVSAVGSSQSQSKQE